MKYLHIIMPSLRVMKGYMMMHRHYFNNGQHFFLTNRAALPEDEVLLFGVNVMDYSELGKGKLKKYRAIKKLFAQYDCILFHGLGISNKWILWLFLNQTVLKKCAWFVWGIDMYNYLLPNKGLKNKFLNYINETVRKKIAYPCVAFPTDKEWFEEKFGKERRIFVASSPNSDQTLEELDKILENIKEGEEKKDFDIRDQTFEALDKIVCKLTNGSESGSLICNENSTFEKWDKAIKDIEETHMQIKLQAFTEQSEPVFKDLDKIIQDIKNQQKNFDNLNCGFGQEIDEWEKIIKEIKIKYAHFTNWEEAADKPKPLIRIMVGNNAHSFNRHKEIIDLLERFKSENIRVVIPANYGEDDFCGPNYVRRLIKYASLILGSKAACMTRFLKLKEYHLFLGSVDIAIFNANRQNALGNITKLLYLGKKIYINKKDNPIFDYLVKVGMPIHDVEELKTISYEEFIAPDREYDKRWLEDTFSEQGAAKQWKEMFDYIEKNIAERK